MAVRLAGDRRMSDGARSPLLVGGAHAVSPLDLVLSIIAVAGQLDDVVVPLQALRRVIRTG